MINAKTSEQILHTLSHASLGARRHPTLAPRPLHDPMADLAIVLYDPTIDDKTPAEDLANAFGEKVDALERGPHKSLKAILGIVDEKKKKEVKVPVVIDPRLAKILRPHQIEGVKVSSELEARHTILIIGSSCIGVRRDLWQMALRDVSWQTRWVSVSQLNVGE
jgi:hypothetical protein